MTPTPRYRYYRRTFLNRPRHHRGAYVIASVEHDGADHPFGETFLEITDCFNRVVLQFPLESARDRRNSVAKAQLLAEVCAEFAQALQAEANSAG